MQYLITDNSVFVLCRIPKVPMILYLIRKDYPDIVHGKGYEFGVDAMMQTLHIMKEDFKKCIKLK